MRCVLHNPYVDDWESALPLVSMIYNSAVHQACKYSPFFLTFLRHPNLPFFDLEESALRYRQSWPTDALRLARKLYPVVLQNLHTHADKFTRAHNLHSAAAAPTFSLGQKVYVHFPRSALPYKLAKLAKPWLPCVVM